MNGKTITSKQNEQLKELRKLRGRRHRERSGLFAAEGEDLLEAALRHGRPPRTVFHEAERFDPAVLPAGVEAVAVSGDALASASALGSGSRVIGVWEGEWAELQATARTAIYLHGVGDPGNVGSVLRSAVALSDGPVILGPGSSDPFGPKAVRASMGAIFARPPVRATFAEARSALDLRAVALVPRSGRPLRELALGEPTLFCLGAERLGLPDEIVSACEATAHVPLRADGADSLNVAMTATLCLYEAAVHTLPSR